MSSCTVKFTLPPRDRVSVTCAWRTAYDRGCEVTETGRVEVVGLPGQWITTEAGRPSGSFRIMTGRRLSWGAGQRRSRLGLTPRFLPGWWGSLARLVFVHTYRAVCLVDQPRGRLS